jgi:hypothetical protein
MSWLRRGCSLSSGLLLAFAAAHAQAQEPSELVPLARASACCDEDRKAREDDGCNELSSGASSVLSRKVWLVHDSPTAVTSPLC